MRTDLVLVSRDALAQLLLIGVGKELPFAMGGHLYPGDAVLTLAVEAGLPLPAPMKPGTVPPAPPNHYDSDEPGRPFGGTVVPTAGTYRQGGDHRLRCVNDGKVIFTSMGQAESAAERISAREPMKAYLGRCGHYHVSRRNGR
jgi:hypothetical protein